MEQDDIGACFADGAAQVATCWSLRRRDGVVLGFTDHDEDLQFDGITFAASSGLVAHAVETSTGGSVDNSQVRGALQSDAVTERDILAGRYRHAEISQWLVDWTNPAVRALQFRGRIGEIRQGDGNFEAELLSLADALSRPVGRSYLKTCDCVLGDGKCGIDTDDAAFRVDGEVLDAMGRTDLSWVDPGGFADGWFTHGVLTWSSGENAGQISAVRQDSVAGPRRNLSLRFETVFDIAAGDQFELVAGCDQRAGTCRDKFDNLVNFRGFPSIPGSDWVTAYPRGGVIPKVPLDGDLD